MNKLIFFLLCIPFLGFSQEDQQHNIDSIFSTIPFKGGEVVYEAVIKLDSINNKEKVFNAAKSVLLNNTNYKHSKIDEDRIMGSLNTEISFFFTVKPGIAKFQFNAKSFVSIDVKENRFRVRIFRNTGKAYLMGEEFDYTMENTLQFEKDKLSAGKLKYEKSIIVSWNENLKTILNAFSVLIKDGVRNADDF
jgi:hypothetical protein